MHLLHFLIQIITWIEWKYMFLLAVNIVHIIHVYRLYWYRSKSPFNYKIHTLTLQVFTHALVVMTDTRPLHAVINVDIIYIFNTKSRQYTWHSVYCRFIEFEDARLHYFNIYILIQARWMSPCYVKILTSIEIRQNTENITPLMNCTMQHL